ncbi:MAG: glycosyltransferase family 4 protein, partial [Planctomycetota bacterium]
MARAILEAGYTVVYDDQATVEHSHDYDAAETRSRTRIDGRFNAEWLDRTCIASKADAHTMVERQASIDEEALRSHGLSGEQLEHYSREAQALRLATFEGLWEGGKTATRLPATRMLDETKLHVLFVVHSFPPEAWAGTEIYTFNLALELQRLGHTCTIFTREDGGPDRQDFTLRETEFQGLRVLRLTHKLQHQRLSESYSQPLYELAFKRVLAWEKPTLVHFQHLLHTSVGLVEIAKRAGLPTVLHLHDYWALCSRVQLIRPDGQICDRNMGLGCYACVKDTALPSAPLLDKMGRESMTGLREFARDAEERAKPGSRSHRRWRDLGDMLERQPLVETAYAAADLRVSPSRFLRTKMLESGSFDPHTLIYSDNGMRTDHVEALEKVPAAGGVVRFGFVGSLVWYKGGEVMVRAMKLLKDAPVSLSIHGSFDPEKDEHHAELVKLSEGAKVEFAGRFDNARLSEVYAEIDVLIVPSIWYENSPVTIHEAWLTGTPVLCSDIGGMEEYVSDGVDGLHFETGSAEDLAAK